MFRCVRATQPAKLETLKRLSVFTQKPLPSTNATTYCILTGWILPLWRACFIVCLFLLKLWGFGQSDFMLEKREFCQRGRLFGWMSTAGLKSKSRCKIHDWDDNPYCFESSLSSWSSWCSPSGRLPTSRWASSQKLTKTPSRLKSSIPNGQR